jgi:hypothetical protein
MKNLLSGKTKSIAARLLAAIILLSPLPMAAQSDYRGQGPGLAVAAQPVSVDEAKWLTYMREEEKLARDIYQKLYEKWNLTVFKNIIAAEDQHFNAVGVLLTRYSVQDPSLNTAAGVYSDVKLNALYKELIAKGTLSIKDALEVGVVVETADIADLEAALQATTKLDIKRVYANLLNGSHNHLEAFQTTLEVLN